MTRLMITAAAAIVLAGCAATKQTTTAPDATHYWESTAPTKQYNVDHASCEQKTKVTADGELDANSTSFEAYRNCMIEQGYTLRNY